MACVPLLLHPQHDLPISSTQGASLADPRDGAFIYYDNEVVNLAVYAHEGCRYSNWTGDIDSIANVSAASITITINGDHEIIASFAPQILEIYMIGTIWIP